MKTKLFNKQKRENKNLLRKSRFNNEEEKVDDETMKKQRLKERNDETRNKETKILCFNKAVYTAALVTCWWAWAVKTEK